MEGNLQLVRLLMEGLDHLERNKEKQDKYSVWYSICMRIKKIVTRVKLNQKLLCSRKYPLGGAMA